MKYRKYLLKLLLLPIVLLQFNHLPVTLAAEGANVSFVCGNLNNQNEGALQGLIVVINEEPLGSNISDITGSGIKRCARKTECTYILDLDNENKNKWECATTYDDISGCGGSEPRPKATPGATYKTCEIVQAYVATSGTDLLFTYIAQIYRYAALTGGIFAVFFLIIGGVMIAASGDNSEAVGKGKGIIIRSISGLILLFLSALILYTVNPNFFTL